MSRRYRLAVCLLATLACVAASAPRPDAAGTAVRNGDWIGSFRLPANTPPVQIDLQLHGSTALVALGPGHAPLQRVTVRRSSVTLGFSLPGVPTPLRFALSSRGKILVGAVTQGSARGRVRLAPGTPTLTRFLGAYRTAGGDELIVLDLSRLGMPPQLIDVGADGLRGLYRTGPAAYAIGAGTQRRVPVDGKIAFGRAGSSLTETLGGARAVAATRMPFRAQEVRIRNGGISLAGTLLLPQGNGPFPAVVMAHGSGPSLRDEGQAFSTFLAAHGIASLTMDKRGEGESSGTYLGDFAGETAIAGYASDTVAGGRFLASLPTIDHRRIGLFGGSQAGWVIPRAAASATALFSFAVILSGPVVSQGESDYYASLCNQGNAPPSMTPAEVDAAVRKAGPSGVDPRPELRTLRIPILWVYGGLDQNQPTRLDLSALASLKATTGADFNWVVFPQANHGLVVTRTGLNSEAASAPGFAPGLFASLSGWLNSHGLGD